MIRSRACRLLPIVEWHSTDDIQVMHKGEMVILELYDGNLVAARSEWRVVTLLLQLLGHFY